MKREKCFVIFSISLFSRQHTFDSAHPDARCGVAVSLEMSCHACSAPRGVGAQRASHPGRATRCTGKQSPYFGEMPKSKSWTASLTADVRLRSRLNTHTVAATRHENGKETDVATSKASIEQVELETRQWLDNMVIGLNLCPFARAALPGTKFFVSESKTLDELRKEVKRELEVLKNAPTDVANTTLVVLSPGTVKALNATTFDGFMEGARNVADEEANALTQSLPEKIKNKLVGDFVEVVPFHPSATFHDTDVDIEDEQSSGGYICTYLDTGDGEDGDNSQTNNPPGEAALREMIAKHASLQGGADTRADWKEMNAKASSMGKQSKGIEQEEEDDEYDDDDSDSGYSDKTADAIDPADFTGRSPHPVLHLLRQSDVESADDQWYNNGPGDDIRAKNAAMLRGMGEDTLRKMLQKCCTKK